MATGRDLEAVLRAAAIVEKAAVGPSSRVTRLPAVGGGKDTPTAPVTFSQITVNCWTDRPIVR